MSIVVNKSPVDAFTLVHTGLGVLARHFGATLPQTLAAGVAWDYFVEPELKNKYPNFFPYPSQDAPAHKFVDAVVPALGWMAYDWWLKKKNRIS